MTLRHTSKAIAGLGFVFAGCLYLMSNLLLQDDISSLEEEVVVNRLERSVNAYARGLDELDRYANQLAPTAQIEHNERRESATLMVVVDPSGSVRSIRQLGHEHLDLQPNQLTRQLSEASLIGRPFKGILSVADHPFLVVSRPEIEDQNFVLLATRLDDYTAPEATDGVTKLLYGDPVEWPSELLGSHDRRQTLVFPKDASTIIGYRTIADVSGNPVAILRADLPRSLYQTGLETQNALVLLFGTFVLATGILFAATVRRTILSPLEILNDKLSQIAQTGFSDERIEIQGSEELTELGERVNAVLGRVQRSETDLIRTERMRVAGELSAGISHNLNNILTGILGPSEYLEQSLEDPEHLVEARRIHRAAIKARDLVARFSQAVRHGTPVRSRAVDVNLTLNQAIETARPKWQDEAQSRGIQIEIGPDLKATLPVQGTTDELHDLAVNLLLNAVDALRDGGTIHVSTADHEGRVRICVVDNGMGMDARKRTRLFEPLFTHKATIGAGLGLSTVHGTVRRWGGEIDVESSPGEGATFTVDLPRSWEAVPVPEVSEPTTERSGRVLIVEDDEVVREVLEASLEEAHELVFAEEGAKAMTLIEKGRFDVALIDLSLPNVPGDQIARRIRQVDETVVTVLMTGWDLGEDDARRVPFDDHMPKPMSSREDLREVVSQCLQVHDARTLRA